MPDLPAWTASPLLTLAALLVGLVAIVRGAQRPRYRPGILLGACAVITSAGMLAVILLR